MGRTLCKLATKETLENDLDGYAKLVKGAKFVCAKCGRAAAKKKHLCKPKKV